MTSGGPSIRNILLLYISLIGLGALGGYAGFYYSFSERCSALLLDMDGRHNISRHAYQEKYEAAIEGQRQCMVESSVKKELNQLQDQLATQATVADRYQALLEKQENTLERLSTLQQLGEENGNTIHDLRGQLSQARIELTTTQQTLEALTSERNALEEHLHGQLTEQEEILEHKEEELQSMYQSARATEFWVPALQEELSHIKAYFAQRSYALCKLKYGTGTLKVEFTLAFPSTMTQEGPTTFIVELAAVTELPHTVLTFLELVDLQLFDGTAFVAANDQQIEGGSPNHATVTRSLELYETYAKFGYSRAPLAFNEYSEKRPHAPWTIGFVGSPHAGPGLVINTADNTSLRMPTEDKRGGEPCFGTIVSGFDTLTRIQSARKSADGYRLAMNVEIASVRLYNSSVQQTE